MKKYEKPILNMLSLTGSEQLCGSCKDDGASILLYKDQSMWQTIDWLVGNGDGKLTRDETASLFGTGEGCSKTVEMYCKYTGTNTAAWS